MIQNLNSKFEGELEHPFPYDLDDFQKHCIQKMKENIPSNILVAVPTGSGKSLPFEFAVIHNHSIGKKVIYLSPIKSLSNQKFYELTKKYPHISIGIITGDNKHNPLADVLIMTTEILLNILMKKNITVNDVDYNIDLSEVSTIVFDEVHYINDASRGNIVEKCILSIPKHITLLMLSATLDKPLDFLTWVHSCNQNRSYLLTHENRIVPLVFHYGIYTPKISKEMLGNSKFINNMNHLMDLSSKKVEDDKMNKLLQLSSYYQTNRVNLKWLITECAKQLHQKELCPAIFFVFSKKNCHNLADSIQMSFIDTSDAALVEHDIDYYLRKTEHAEQYKKTPQYESLVRLAKKGVGVHHSGLIPIFKEITELLFSKQLIKVLFATETFSVGLNMPTKTVVFTDVYKFDNSGKRILLPHEFIQMSGRAGRRGLDKIGHIILLPQIFSQEITRLELNGVLLGKSQSIESKFYIDDKLILDFIRENNLTNLNDFVKKSLLVSEMDKRKIFVTRQLALQQVVVDGLTEHLNYSEYSELLHSINDFIQPSANQKKKMISRMKEIEKEPDFKKHFEQYKSATEMLTKLKNELTYLQNHVEEAIEERFRILQEDGYFGTISGINSVLTKKGEVSLLFNELDNILGTEIVFSELHTPEQFIIALTLVSDGKNSDEYSIPKEAIEIQNMFMKMKDKELNKQYVYPMLDWYNGKEFSAICTDDNVFDGDLIKIVNKICNCIDELIRSYILINQLEKVVMLTEVKETLRRDIISNESLYLRL